MATAKNRRFLRIIHNNNNNHYHHHHHHQFHSDGFSQSVLKRSLHHLYHYRPFFLRNVSFSCTVWTKMRPLAGSIADGALVDAI